MLSYRHAFHAGNHADVLKHYIFSIILDYFNQKTKPYTVIDTHSGTGLYDFNDVFAQKNLEFKTGISRLIGAKYLPKSINKYIEVIESFNQNDNLYKYPGSPKVSEYFLREYDQLKLFELHSNDYKQLKNNFLSSNKKQINIEMRDGFEGLIANLPPSSKRGIAIIDPPYEEKHDYARVVSTISKGLKRFSTGCYMVWYPLLQRKEPSKMVDSLRSLSPRNWSNITLEVKKPAANGYGMHGSGVFIINPPWILPSTLKESLPFLELILGEDTRSSKLEFNIE